jgi:hypothetical protein
LVQVVSQKTGLSQEQSRAAAQAVLDFLMTKLPAPVAEQVKSTLTGGGNLSDISKGLGGMFGKK